MHTSRPDRQLSARQRLSRRQLVRYGALGGAAVAVGSAIGCRGSSRQAVPSDATAQQPKRGGVLNHVGGDAGYADDTHGRGFDPHVVTQDVCKGYSLFYERLLAYSLTSYEIQPELAQKWEQPSPTEYLFHLQPGVKWQNKPPVNGRTLTADDVLWSMERARTNDPKFLSRSFLSGIDQIQAPDQATVRITTKTPDVSTLEKLSADNMVMLAREVFDKYPKPATAEAVVGTGPFVLKSVEENVGGDYVRNPDYWKPGLPYLDGFRTKAFTDPLTAWSAFQSTQLDEVLVPASSAKAYLSQQGSQSAADWFADDTIAYVYPNVRVKPMDDARVPRALRLLIDHDEFIKGWAEAQFGRGRHGAVFCPALAGWDLTDADYESHLEWRRPKDAAVKEALALLAGAGFTRDNPLRFDLDSFNNTAYSAATQLLQAQWQRLGGGVVDAQLQLHDPAAADKIKASRSFSYAYFGLSAMVEPDVWLSTAYHSAGSQNIMGYSDPALDAMIEKQRTVFDDRERKAAVKEIVLYLIDHGPSTVPAGRYFLNGLQPRVRNHVPEYHMNGRQYQTVWLAS
jgi:peptide/nickel transport system substrate-binding protein